MEPKERPRQMVVKVMRLMGSANGGSVNDFPKNSVTVMDGKW